MRNLVVLLALAVFLSIPRPDPVLAGPNANAKILIHLIPAPAKNRCTRSDATPPCSGINTSGDLYPAKYIAYVLVTDADSAAGVAGVQFGVSYNDSLGAGVDIESWTNCAKLQFAMDGWPASGTGNLITWDRTTQCQRFEPGGSGTGVVAVVGYFYCTAYGQDTLRVIPRPVDGMAKVAACDATEDILAAPCFSRNPYPLGFAVLDSGAISVGYNPCGQYAGPLEPVWQFDVPDAEKPTSLQPEGAAFPLPVIMKNSPPQSSTQSDWDPRFPMESVTLFRVIPTGDFGLTTITNTVLINPDGTFAGPLCSPLPLDAIGLSLSSPPCFATGLAISPRGSFSILGTGSTPPTSDQSSPISSIQYFPHVGIAVASSPAITNVYSFASGRTSVLPGGRCIAASNDRAGTVGFAIGSTPGPGSQLYVLNSSADIVYQHVLPDMPTEMALQSGRVVLSMGKPPNLREQVLSLPEGALTNASVLPAGLRYFANEGDYLLIHDLAAQVLHFYDIHEPLNPHLLWSRGVADVDYWGIMSVAVSPTGRLVAYQVQRSRSRGSTLYVVSREGADLGHIVHAEPFTITGVAFIDDRYLLEGVYRRGFIFTTQTGRLYDFGREKP